MTRHQTILFARAALTAGLLCAGAFHQPAAARPAQAGLNAAATPQPGPAPNSGAWGGLPLYFEPAPLAADQTARFIARADDCQFLIRPTGVAMMLRRSGKDSTASPQREAGCRHAGPGRAATSPGPREFALVRFEFVGASAGAQIAGAAELPGKINYLIGNDPAQWRTGVPAFARLLVRQLYPGVDLVYYGNRRQLEYDFVVAPGVDPGVISIRFRGVDALRLDQNGDLVLKFGDNEIRQHKPVMFQIAGGQRREIKGAYRLMEADTVGFAVGDYDHELPLIIDPVLSYSTYLGGGLADTAWAVAVDAAGYVYVAGDTLSAQLPTTPGAFSTNYSGGFLTGDAFVAKFDNSGSNLVYLTYLGGGLEDSAWAIAVDDAGQVYLTGLTDSTNFPVVAGFQTSIGGRRDIGTGYYPVDAFVAKLNATGSGLVYSSYLGGGLEDVGIGIAVDALGNACVTGYTQSTNFPVTNALFGVWGGGREGFVAKIAPNGALVYSTYLGGNGTDGGQGVVFDPDGFVYVTGFTSSTNFPVTTNALQTLLNGTTNASSAMDVFVTKLTPAGDALVYSTYLGGASGDVGYRVKVDAQGAAYVTGYTYSTDFPNTATNVPGLHAGVRANSLSPDAFLTKLAADGGGIVYSAVFGGVGIDQGWDLAVDPAGNAIVVGVTGSTNFPTVTTGGLLSATNSGGYDVFVTAFNTDASALLYSALLGGSASDYGYGIATDPAGNAYVVGKTYSTNFPVAGAFQATNQGGDGGFLAKILLEPTLVASISGSDVIFAWRAFSPGFVLESATDLGSPNWTSVAASPQPIGGWHIVALPATNDAAYFRLRKH